MPLRVPEKLHGNIKIVECSEPLSLFGECGEKSTIKRVAGNVKDGNCDDGR